MYTRFLALSLMTFLALRRGVGKLRIPAIMGTIVVVLPGYIHLAFCTRDDPTSWMGKCDRPFSSATNDA